MEISDPTSVLRIADADYSGLRSPVMVIALSGWFDVGGTASAALEGIIEDRTSITVAEIDPDPFYDFTQARPEITIDGGIIDSIDWPSNRFDMVRGDQRDIIVLIGNEPHLAWRTYVGCITVVAGRLGCEAVVTIGAAAEAVPHTRVPLVTGSTTDAELARRLGLGSPTYQGMTGVVGVLQAALDHVGIPAVSLRVGVPHYLANAEHPQATAALQTHLSHVLGLGITTDLRPAISRWRQLHDEVVDDDPRLAEYVRILEREFDRAAEAAIPTADDLGARFEEYLRQQRPED